MYLINQLVEFNPDSKSLVNRQTGRAIQLQLPASLCFLYLITHASDIVSQSTLMKVGWGERNNVTTTNTFYQAILTLRNALADVGLPRDTVKTISRRGLRLNENTQVEAITHPESDVYQPPVIEDYAPPKIIPPRLNKRRGYPGGTLFLALASLLPPCLSGWCGIKHVLLCRLVNSCRFLCRSPHDKTVKSFTHRMSTIRRIISI